MSGSQKSFEQIHDAYTFFQSHSTEARECQKALAHEIAQFAPSRASFSITDFGCGDGKFTEGVLSKCSVSKEAVSLTLIEPDRTYRQSAIERLASFTHSGIRDSSSIEPSHIPTDLLISNHALYYVPDLSKALSDLLRAVQPNGILLITLANSGNALLKAWDYLFGLINEKCPFFRSEDLEEELETRGLNFRKITVPSELTFDDTRENRTMILQFLLGQHIHRLGNIDAAVAFFDSYSNGRAIKMPLHDELFAVSRKNEI